MMGRGARHEGKITFYSEIYVFSDRVYCLPWHRNISPKGQLDLLAAKSTKLRNPRVYLLWSATQSHFDSPLDARDRGGKRMRDGKRHNIILHELFVFIINSSDMCRSELYERKTTERRKKFCHLVMLVSKFIHRTEGTRNTFLISFGCSCCCCCFEFSFLLHVLAAHCRRARSI